MSAVFYRLLLPDIKKNLFAESPKSDYNAAVRFRTIRSGGIDMEMDTQKRLSEYNSIIKETDELYRDAAKALGLSDCAFWLLYALREEDGGVTQRDICDMFYQPKQTVNSALKKLEADGYIQLAEMEDRRSKQINLTKPGRCLAEKTVDRVIAVERSALSGLTEAEQEEFIRLFRKYADLLRTQLQTLNHE